VTRTLAAVLCLATSSTTVNAQTAADPKNIELPAQGWTVNCANANGGLVCQASQAIVVARTRQVLVAVTIAKSSGASGHAMSLQLPHGLFLPAGANLQVDAEPAQAVVVETCDERGCHASVPVSEKMLAAMRKGTTMTVTFQNMTKSNVKVQLPLGGFPDAIKKL
jgi:invasion protein IalB